MRQQLFILLLLSNICIAQIPPIPYGAGATTNPTPLYQSPLTIDATQCGSSNSTNFTVLVSFTDTRFKTVANGGHVAGTYLDVNGYPTDIQFFSNVAYTVLMKWEIEYYSATTGQIIAWVLVNTVSNTVNTTFYIGYGATTITSFTGGTAGSAWNTGYTGVWHLPNGTTLSAIDYTASGHAGTTTSVTATSGNIDGAGSFNGSSSYIFATNSMSITSTTFTLSAWVNLSSSTSVAAFPRVIDIHDATNSAQIIWDQGIAGGSNFWVTKDNQWQTGVTGTQWGVMPSFNTWYYLVAIFNSSSNTTLFYVNSTSETGSANSNAGAAGSANTTYMGVRGGLNAVTFFKGIIDEVRVSNTSRSQDWITTEYNNQKASSTFLTLGTET